MKDKITAKTILNLLLKKHYKDLCIPECKTGSTWWTNYLKMDLWVMKKSWTQPFTYCYEIKASRSDFLNDNKWKEYLKYCTDLYFVAPPGIILQEELPNEVGLITTSTNCKRLFTKKKAVSRGVDIPESLFRYILMWRSIQKNENEIISSKSYWKEWINTKEIDYKFGRMVSKNIRKIVKEKIEKIRIENDILRIENNNLNHIKEIMLELGFKDNDFKRFYYNEEIKFRNKLKEISKGETGDFEKYLKEIILNLNNALLTLEKRKNDNEII